MLDSKEIARRALLLAAETRARRKRRRSILTVSVAIFVCASVIAVITIRSVTQSGRELSVPEITDAQVPLAMPDINDASVTYPSIETVTIRYGEATADMPFTNPATNACYLTFEIILTDTGERLCISEMVAPSGNAGEQTLLIELAEGTYNAEIIMKAYEINSYAELEMTSLSFEIIVE